MDMFCVRDPVVFLSKCQSEGWEVICADDKPRKKGDQISGNTESDGKDIKKAGANNRIIVFGSEGEGVDSDILELADSYEWVQNRMNNKDFPNSLVDSLNVSVAAGIVLNNLLK